MYKVNTITDKNCEICAIELITEKCIIIALYRSPQGDMEILIDTMHNVLDIAHSSKKNIIVVGDFNVNFQTESKNSSDVLNMFLSYGLHPTIKTSTRIGSTSNTCIDNIFTNYHKSLYNSETSNPLLSDHYAVLLFAELSPATADCKYHTYRRINENGIQMFVNKLSEVNWNFIKNDSDVNASFNQFNDYLLQIFQSAFPLKTSQIKTNKTKQDWFTPTLHFIRQTLHFLYDCMIKLQNPDITSIYKKYKKYYRDMLNFTKKSANDQYIYTSSNKTKAVWSIINKEINTSSKCTTRTSLTPDNFNQYFTTVAPDIIKNIAAVKNTAEELLENNLLRNMGTIFMYPTDTTEIESIINNLKNTCSKDIYEISTKVLKIAGKYISDPLENIFNMCIQTGTFPDALKLAKVVPVHKKDNINELNNYRPISVLPSLSKILENIIKSRLINYMESKNLLTDCQHGFRSSKSTSTALNSTIDYIHKILDKKQQISATLCDLSKAFDCVSHTILINKLQFYGIRGVPLDLIRSYLNNRYQIVYLNGKKSSLRLNECGVPQGSILGPIFFILYINDLPEHIKCDKTILYADDTTFFQICNKGINLSQCHILEQAELWFNANKLQLNAKKTQHIMFSTRSAIVNNARNISFLGVQLDNHLTWKHHIDLLSKKLSSVLFALRKLKACSSTQVVKTAYYALFHSHITYGLILWGSIKYSKNIFILQKQAIRIICNASNRSHCRPLFKEQNILPLPCLYIYYCLINVKRNISTYEPISLNKNYETRLILNNPQNLTVPRINLHKSMNNPNHFGIILYNKLPNEIKRLEFNRFKTEIKNILYQHCFYDIEEYRQCNSF